LDKIVYPEIESINKLTPAPDLPTTQTLFPGLIWTEIDLRTVFDPA